MTEIKVIRKQYEYDDDLVLFIDKIRNKIIYRGTFDSFEEYEFYFDEEDKLIDENGREPREYSHIKEGRDIFYDEIEWNEESQSYCNEDFELIILDFEI